VSDPQNPPPAGPPPSGDNNPPGPPPSQRTPEPQQPPAQQPPPAPPAGGQPYAGATQPPPPVPPPYQPPQGYPPQQPPQGYPPQQPPQGYPPGYAGQPAAYPMQAAAEDPGKTLGIIGLVLSFFTALIGMIISIVALLRSRKAGFKNTPAIAGIVIGGLVTVFWIIAAIVFIAALVSATSAACDQLGPGIHVVNGVTITCN
jgi:hypothetical protein